MVLKWSRTMPINSASGLLVSLDDRYLCHMAGGGPVFLAAPVQAVVGSVLAPSGQVRPSGYGFCKDELRRPVEPSETGRLG